MWHEISITPPISNIPRLLFQPLPSASGIYQYCWSAFFHIIDRHNKIYFMIFQFYCISFVFALTENELNKICFVSIITKKLSNLLVPSLLVLLQAMQTIKFLDYRNHNIRKECAKIYDLFPAFHQFFSHWWKGCLVLHLIWCWPTKGCWKWQNSQKLGQCIQIYDSNSTLQSITEVPYGLHLFHWSWSAWNIW